MTFLSSPKQCGNFLIIAAVVSTPKLRTVTNYFILSLAVADFLVGICVLPPAIMLHTTQGEQKKQIETTRRKTF